MQALYPTKWNAAMGEMTDSNGVLSVQAKVWRRALAGITSDQIRSAIDHLTDNYSPFIPDLGEFKKLCVVGTEKDVPSAEKIMHMIIRAAYAQGSIADRYKHPLAWAVAKHPDIDNYSLKTAATKQALAMVTPIYTEILRSGYPPFTKEDFEVRLAVEKKKSPTNDFEAKKHLSAVRGLVGHAKPVKKVCADESSYQPSAEDIARFKREKERIKGILAQRGVTDFEIEEVRKACSSSEEVA